MIARVSPGVPQDRFNETSYLRTMQPSASDLVDYLFTNLPFKIKKESKVLLVTAGDRSEMLSYREAYLKKLKDSASITQVEVIEQTHDLRQFNEILQKDAQWDYVVLLTRSLIAAELSDLIYEKSSPIILGTKYFGSSELPAFFNYLKNKKVQAYISRQNCSCDSAPDYQKLRAKYVQAYGIDPMSISIDSYDATKFILKSLKTPKRNVEQVLSFLNSKEANFLGVSSLKVAEGLKLSSTKRFLIKIDETGYKEVK